MARSPREELRVVSVTEFRENEDGVWEFEQQEGSGLVSYRGAGFADFNEAAEAFFEAVGYDPATVSPTEAHYSVPIKVDKHTFHIREYAHGAPEPFTKGPSA